MGHWGTGERNQALVPAKIPSETSGNHYQFIDQPVDGGKTYTYWLEVVASGGSNMRIPSVVTTFYVYYKPINSTWKTKKISSQIFRYIYPLGSDSFLNQICLSDVIILSLIHI